MIGITERGDACLDRSWVEKQHLIDGLILITKRCDEEFVSFVQEKATVPYIIHATCTGYGGTVVEPNVVKKEEIFKALKKADKEKVVLRIDPIFLTERGVENAIRIMEEGIELGVKRIRFSFLDLYPHVRKRFKEAGLVIKQDNSLAEKWFERIKKVTDVSFESCGESTKEFPEISKYASGCVSQKDMDLMGLAAKAAGVSHQRISCLCCAQKYELLEHKTRCAHGCIYCYWVDANRAESK